MNEITLTINGKQVKGKQGDTVLEVCQANGVDVPTLCHMDGLSDVGACRICMVEIEKERRPVPSCTYPARDGLVVKTNTERLEKYRRQILELIFTEHNHFCMFCEQSGDCELQKLAYRYQMDNVRYLYSFPSLSVDSLSDYLVIDHNRCILCGRCVRACGEVATSHTLSFTQRGWKTEVAADLNQPLGESSCRLCGACVQACPTGAIFSKLSIYKGRTEDCQRVKTICPACGVGCELDVLVKDNNLVKIEAPNLTGDLKGALCQMGRFGLLQPTPPRITSALVRDKEGELKECSLDKAVETIASRIAKAKGGVAGMISTRLPNETLSLFQKFISGGVGNDSIDTLDGEIYRTISEGMAKFQNNGKGLAIECPIEDILKADCIIIVGADPQQTNPIVGTLVRKVVGDKESKLVIIDSSRNVFPLWSDTWIKPKTGSEGMLLNGLAKILVDKGLAKQGKAGSLSQYGTDKVAAATGIGKEEMDQIAELYGRAKHAVIIYGEGLLKTKDANAVTAILNLAKMTGNETGDKLRVISLKPGANSRGAWELGLAKGIKKEKPQTLYLLLSDEPESLELLRWLRGVHFLVVQASYYSPAIYMADVVLPSSIWAEREGKYIDMDGQVQELKRVLEPKDGLPRDEESLIGISKKLGYALS